MSMLQLIWKTIVLFICSIIQVIGVLIEGMAKILSKAAKLLEIAHDRVYDLKIQRKKKVHIDVPL